VRALGCSLGVAVNRLTSGVISMTFISLSKAMTIGGAFFLFAGIASFAWVFFFAYLPETRGRTLEDMSSLFGSTATQKGAKEADDRRRREGEEGGNGRHQLTASWQIAMPRLALYPSVSAS